MSNDVSEKNTCSHSVPYRCLYRNLSDANKLSSFKSAIEAIVPTGAMVVELGGGTGILSFFAASRAKSVWCVESNPQLAKIARESLRLSGVADKVEVVEVKPEGFVPPQPVDLVICDMLHPGVLRENQLRVIESFKRNYLLKFPGKLPIFLPDTTLVAVQAVQQEFSFEGYHAQIPLYLPATSETAGTAAITEPFLYSVFEYKKTLPEHFVCSQDFTIAKGGMLNALRLITKNVLAVLIDSSSSIDWHTSYLVVPLREPVTVKEGDKIRVSFSYPAGAPLETLIQSAGVRIL